MTTATLVPPAGNPSAETASPPAGSLAAATSPAESSAAGASAADTSTAPQQIVVEADEIIFRAGEATITLSKSQGGIVEIHAPTLRLTGDDILSEAAETNTTAGRRVVSEAISVSELLGRLVRVDGQCVKIS